MEIVSERGVIEFGEGSDVGVIFDAVVEGLCLCGYFEIEGFP